MMRSVLCGFALLATLLVAGCAKNHGTSCEVGYTDCDGVCKPLMVDPANCGMCGMACSAGESCVAGVCGGTLPDASVTPDMTTVRPDGGTTNMCDPACTSSQRCCGTSCVSESVASGSDGRSDSSFSNCGGCGRTCDMNKASACSGATPTCMCGASPACTGSKVCSNVSGTFRCVDQGSDPNNCGTPGNMCTDEEICEGGACVCGRGGSECTSGTTCCGDACINTTNDNNNCGGCGRVCPGGTTCNAGMCTCGSTACRPSGTSSPTDLGQLCCTGACVEQNNDNCGTCGNMCPTLFDPDSLGIDPSILTALCFIADDPIACAADPVSYLLSTFIGGGSGGSFSVGCGMGTGLDITGGGATGDAQVCCQTGGFCTDMIGTGGGGGFPGFP